MLPVNSANTSSPVPSVSTHKHHSIDKDYNGDNLSEYDAPPMRKSSYSGMPNKSATWQNSPSTSGNSYKCDIIFYLL